MNKAIRILLACVLLAGVGLGAWAGVEKVRRTSERATHRERAAHQDTGGGTVSVAPLAGHDHAMGALSLLPPEMRGMAARTEEAYLFSVANPAVAQAVPCYCGCVGLGHVSSYDCYVAEADGVIVYDTHAVNCGVCVDITQDVMRLLDEGRAPPEIRAIIDDAYAVYGPPTPLHDDDHSS